MTKAQFIDLTGKRFGRLFVVKRVGQYVAPCGAKQTRWLCTCDCGNETTQGSRRLRTGGVVSCGCKRREKHPDAAVHTLEYTSWRAMKERCNNSRSKLYKHYGARGIRICDEWVKDFEAFRAHVGPRPAPKYTIERIDVNGHYEPGNVRWATAAEQVNNRRVTRFVLWKGDRVALTDAARAAGAVVHPQTAWNRMVRSGWSAEDAFLTPPKSKFADGR